MAETAALLAERHYLGPARRGVAWSDEAGVIIVAPCTARHLPQAWREIIRWCIVSDEKNAGSQQWRRFIRAFREAQPTVTTIVSYSDPSAGHDGALYRACNWWWAPTWHRLRPPPTGNGSWREGHQQSVKDRWVFPVRRDPLRPAVLLARDEGILLRQPEARYREPGGVPWRLTRSHAAADDNPQPGPFPGCHASAGERTASARRGSR